MISEYPEDQPAALEPLAEAMREIMARVPEKPYQMTYRDQQELLNYVVERVVRLRE